MFIRKFLFFFEMFKNTAVKNSITLYPNVEKLLLSNSNGQNFVIL